MRKISKFAAAALILAMSAACGNNEEAAQENLQSQRTPLQVVSQIQTRASKEAWASGDAIGVYSLDGTTAEYSNYQYTTTGNGVFDPASEASTILLPADNSARSIVGYYPYSASVSGGVIPVDVSNQENQEAIDLLVSNTVGGVTKDSPLANLNFYHKLSRIEMAISPGLGITADQMAQMTVTLDNQYTTGSYDIMNEQSGITVSGQPTTVSLLMADDGTTAEAIILPTESTEGMSFTFTIPEMGSYTFVVGNAAGSQSFVAGNKYKYTVLINRTGLTITSTIEDWGAGNGENGENIVAE